MRAVVMAALHFDFGVAQSMSNQSETVLPYNEDQINMQNFINLLNQLRQLSDEQNKATHVQGKQIVSEKIKQLKELNDRVYMRVKNPYLRLFFLIMIDSHFTHRRSFAKILIEFNKNYVMNLFDYVAICCKFLDTAPLKEVLDDKMRSDITMGNLQVFALIGLRSEHGPRVIQNFIDRTGDL